MGSTFLDSQGWVSRRAGSALWPRPHVLQDGSLGWAPGTYVLCRHEAEAQGRPAAPTCFCLASEPYSGSCPRTSQVTQRKWPELPSGTTSQGPQGVTFS